MKRIYLGVIRLSGLSQKTNKNYDFTKVNLLIPIRSKSVGATFFGYEQQTLDATPELLDQLRSIPPLTECEFITELDPDSREPKVIVTGVSLVNKKAAA